jgi:adenine-specific DNA-methyltransferase
LRRVCDEVFGEFNFLTDIVWNHTKQSKNDEQYFSRHHNQILVYRKSDDLGPFKF